MSTTNQIQYAELHCVSNFTFLRGASHPDELVAQAKELGYSALCLSDECSLAGIVRAHVAAKKLGIKLLIGTELALSDGLRVVVIATNRNGYGNLSVLITHGRRHARKGHYHLCADDLTPAALSDCLIIWLPGKEPQVEHGLRLKQSFPHQCWIAVELFLEASDAHTLRRLEQLAQELDLPLVAAGDVHMHIPARQALQDTLTAIRLRTTVQTTGLTLHPNAQRHLRPLSTLMKIFPAALLLETQRLVERCHFSLDELRYEYPDELIPPGMDAATHLRQVTEAGLRVRWPQGEPPRVRQQVEHELALICQLHYEHYFLTVHDIVRYARQQGILCQGRGSAANSAVCFCLGITEVDPARINMLFERFISKERNEPPDIDVDFEHDQREQVFQYIYNKYGRGRAALAATVISYRPKSALREVGKALGLELDRLERLSKAVNWWEGEAIDPAHMRDAGLDPGSAITAHVLNLANELIGFPRHLSQHVGGFVISKGPLSRLVPIENAAMPERTIIQWDKDDLDALGLLKIDCLALGMLSAIHRAFDYIAQFRGTPWTLATVPAEDPRVYTMIQQGDTLGVFQIESRAQIAMLPRLRPQNYYDLVIEVAIIRPGPIQGDMVHPYLRRRCGLEPVSYPSAALQQVLERTLGIPIFQEQVMQVAIVAAGFTPGEADQLRRAMAAWRRRGHVQHFEDKLIQGMRERGYTEQFAQQIFQQILGFGEYGFPESHAASFALLVYVSSWLKCYEPAAFTCALLNSQPMGFYAPSQLIQDARRHHIDVREADVCFSDWDCRLEPGAGADPALRLGLRLVKTLGKAAAERIVRCRAEQVFVSVTDLAQRAQLNKKDLDALAAADALRSLCGHRRQAHWDVLGVTPASALALPASDQNQQLSFAPPSEFENIVSDYAQLGYTLRRHPLALLRSELRAKNILSSDELSRVGHGARVRVAGLVTCRQRPSSSSGVTFVTLEDECGYVNGVIWKRLAQRRRPILLNAQLLVLAGKVEREGPVIHLVAYDLEDLSQLLGELRTSSRDFH